jgi:transposase-like protein/IS1 family transposase
LAEKGQVNCYCCHGKAAKFGRFENKNRIVQRYRCGRCNQTFSEEQPLGDIRIEHSKVVQIIKLLCEGMGVRATARLVDCHRDTVLAVLEEIGGKCAPLLDARVRYVKSRFVETDEIYTYVGRRKRHNLPDEPDRGEFFTFLSVDAESKLVINWKVDKRTFETTENFLHDLKARMLDRFQLTTDAFNGYCRTKTGGVGEVFKDSQIDYATEKKNFGHVQVAPFRFLTKVKAIKRKARIGNPDMNFATTCHCERMNLSVRQFSKRFNRATLGYSKTLANLRHAVALFVAHFNYCRVHGAIKQTPAQAAMLTKEVWTVEKLIEECGKC